MKTVMLVFGTRPEAIKMCPLVNELKSRKNINTVVCVTGQHRQMLDQVLNAFNVVPDYDLSIMKDIKLSTLFITHDIDEAILLSDRIYILGNTPTSIKEEIVISGEDVRNPDLLLKDTFLEYKRKILSIIGEK